MENKSFVVRDNGLGWATRFRFQTETGKMYVKTVLLRTRKSVFSVILHGREASRT
jgi:hypothetical protein